MLHLVCLLCQTALWSVPSSGPGAPLRALALPEAVVGTLLARKAALVPQPVLAGGVNSLGTTIALRNARRLTLSVTPSPARCAPLLELDF
jgi:hypothetical protein